MKKHFNLLQVILLMVLAASVTLVTTYYYTESRIASRLASVTEAQQTFSRLNEVKRCVEENYVGDFNSTDLATGAIKGYLSSLGDRWTYYLSGDEYQATNAELSGGYVGIGLRVSYDAEADQMCADEVYVGSPAENAGIHAGDVITAIGGVNVADVGFDSAKELLQGESGSSVMLKLLRNGEEMEITAVRAYVRQENVLSAALENKIGYIRIKEFSDGADAEFIKQLEELISKGMKSFVFDVRSNGGGKLEILLKVLDRLLPNCVSMITEDKAGVRVEYNSDSTSLNLPIAVLVNRSTYSTAEYFAAVLQEYGRAVVIGEQTTGKGYGQSTIELSDGSAIVLSTLRYYTPQGRTLAGSGCIPNAEVELKNPAVLAENIIDPNEDSQLFRACDTLSLGE